MTNGSSNQKELEEQHIVKNILGSLHGSDFSKKYHSCSIGSTNSNDILHQLKAVEDVETF